MAEGAMVAEGAVHSKIGGENPEAGHDLIQQDEDSMIRVKISEEVGLLSNAATIVSSSNNPHQQQ